MIASWSEVAVRATTVSTYSVSRRTFYGTGMQWEARGRTIRGWVGWHEDTPVNSVSGMFVNGLFCSVHVYF